MQSLPLTLTNIELFPVRLVEITRLDGSVKRLAEAEIDIVNDGDTYVALPGCQIGAVTQALGGEQGSLSIKFAHSDGGVFDTFELDHGLYDAATVRLYIADRDDLSKPKGLRFTGTIQPIGYDILGGGSFDIRSQDAEAEAFIQAFGPVCRTDLFSVLCQVNKAPYAMTGTIASIDSAFTATISSLSTPPVGVQFDQGSGVTETGFVFEICHWNQGTGKLTTYLPVCVLYNVGDAVTLYPGCDKTEGANGCGGFNNLINRQAESHFLGVAAAQGA